MWATAGTHHSPRTTPPPGPAGIATTLASSIQGASSRTTSGPSGVTQSRVRSRAGSNPIHTRDLGHRPIADTCL